MADSASDEKDIQKRIVKALLRITLRGGAEFLFRHTNMEHAYMIQTKVSDLMVECWKNSNTNPFITSTILVDRFAKADVGNKTEGGKEVTNIAFGPKQEETSCLDVREVVAVALVCPGCCQVIKDRLPGHIVDEDGECKDPLIEGRE